MTGRDLVPASGSPRTDPGREQGVSDLGFSGSRGGITPEQKLALISFLQALYRAPGFTRFHHGDCRGADDIAARAAYEIGYEIIVHPGPDGRDAGRWRRAVDQPRVTVLDRQPFRERNQAIVDASQGLLACPSGAEEDQRRSGTWQTVRMARARGIDCWVIPPDVNVYEPVAAAAEGDA